MFASRYRLYGQTDQIGNEAEIMQVECLSEPTKIRAEV